VLEFGKIVVLGVVAACVYGVAQDQLTVRLSLEYFTVAHPKLVDSQAPGHLALAWGVAATWWLGAGLGVVLAVAARAGGRPPRDAASLLRPIALLLVATAIGASALGAAGWWGARSGSLRLRDPYAAEIPAARHARFFGAWGATAGSYATGTLGALGLGVAVWRDRGRAARREASA
jgi:hypothetical protein